MTPAAPINPRSGTPSLAEQAIAAKSDNIAHKPYYGSIDGLRAICVLLVMINHYTGAELGIFIPNAYLGVDIFFVISGFLITSLLRLEFRQTGKVDLPSFYWRRAFRILPVYFAVLLLYIAVCQLPSLSAKWIQLKSGLPWFLTFMNEFAHEVNNGNVFTHTWSLGIEEKFYLVWPILFFVIARTSRVRVFVTGATLVAVMAEAFVSADFQGRSYYGLLIGAIMGILLTSRYATAIAAFVRQIPAAVVLALFLFAFYLESKTHNVMLGFTCLTVLFMTHLVVRKSWLSAALGSAPLVWLGRRSYSMYLVHVLCLNALEGNARLQAIFHPIGVLLLAYAASAVMAALLFIAVEEPSRLYGRKFINRRNERHKVATPS